MTAAANSVSEPPSKLPDRTFTHLIATGTGLGPEPIVLAEIRTDDCIESERGSMQISLKLSTSLGQHRLRLVVPSTQETAINHAATFVGPPSLHTVPPPPQQRLEIEADGQSMHLAEAPSTFVVLQSQACERPTQLIADDKLTSDLREVLSRISPDCESVALSSTGFHCELPITTAQHAKRELVKIRTTMIRTWSRQPYVLTRRLSIGLQLADALESSQAELALHTFCKIIKSSQPIELPATFTSSRWQGAVCNVGLHLAQRQKVAGFGLAKVVLEIDFLRQLFERTSKLGELTLKLPEPGAPTGEIWVSLRPEADLAERLAKEAARLWLNGSTRQKQRTIDTLNSCWHPVYAENEYLLVLAQHLTLAGQTTQIKCDGAKTETAALARYVTDSITSETEFLMPNRQSKTLRLPAGSYHYELRGMPADPSEWDDAAQADTRTTGRIVWGDKRPRPIISVW